mmetsp:Transcript_6475/g.22947  ORF Transcript_6475/g.22947 Transcript_6475/m.22947 type:complete len:221 (-) Transcript_6475:365-1027(-)
MRGLLAPLAALAAALAALAPAHGRHSSAAERPERLVGAAALCDAVRVALLLVLLLVFGGEHAEARGAAVDVLAVADDALGAGRVVEADGGGAEVVVEVDVAHVGVLAQRVLQLLEPNGLALEAAHLHEGARPARRVRRLGTGGRRSRRVVALHARRRRRRVVAGCRLAAAVAVVVAAAVAVRPRRAALARRHRPRGGAALARALEARPLRRRRVAVRRRR